MRSYLALGDGVSLGVRERRRERNVIEAEMAGERASGRHRLKMLIR